MVIRQAAAAAGPELSDRARVYAIAYIALADAAIAVFDAKYEYNFWRPLTAIRNGDIDGNYATERDAEWMPLMRRCTPNIRARIASLPPRLVQ